MTGRSRWLPLIGLVLALALGGSRSVEAAYSGPIGGKSSAELRVVDAVRVAGTPVALAVGFNAVWVTDNEDGTVVRIDPKSNRVVATIPVGDFPNAIATGMGAVWVVARGLRRAPNTDTVQRINPKNDSITASHGDGTPYHTHIARQRLSSLRGTMCWGRSQQALELYGSRSTKVMRSWGRRHGRPREQG